MAREAEKQLKAYGKENLSIIIALFSLSISFLGFYYTNIRVNNIATAAVISREEGMDSIKLELVFANVGNRQILIQTPIIGCSTHGIENQLAGGIKVSNADHLFPMIIIPNELKIAKLSFSKIEITKHLHDTKSSNNRYKATNLTLYYDISFPNITADGQRHFNTSNVLNSFYLDKDRKKNTSISGISPTEDRITIIGDN